METIAKTFEEIFLKGASAQMPKYKSWLEGTCFGLLLSMLNVEYINIDEFTYLRSAMKIVFDTKRV